MAENNNFMSLIQTSNDLLLVVIAVCILGLTIFLAWFIYYLAMIMRQAYFVIKEMRERIKKVDQILNSVKEKIDHCTSYLLIIGEGIKKLVELIKDRGEIRERKKKEKK